MILSYCQLYLISISYSYREKKSIVWLLHEHYPIVPTVMHKMYLKMYLWRAGIAENAY